MIRTDFIPNVDTILSPHDAQLFWEKVERKDAAECWPWTASRFVAGYGQFRRVGRSAFAHRTALALTTGVDVPRGLYVLHRCDNPPCCNPAHLFVGTIADNVADMDAKGRRVAVALRGEAHPDCRFSDRDIAKMRRLYAAGKRQADIARAFGCSREHVWSVVHNLVRVLP